MKESGIGFEVFPLLKAWTEVRLKIDRQRVFFIVCSKL